MIDVCFHDVYSSQAHSLTNWKSLLPFLIYIPFGVCGSVGLMYQGSRFLIAYFINPKEFQKIYNQQVYFDMTITFLKETSKT